MYIIPISAVNVNHFLKKRRIVVHFIQIVRLNKVINNKKFLRENRAFSYEFNIFFSVIEA